MSWENNVRRVVPYVPGEQPKEQDIVKLNTNENPYAPSPMVTKALREMRARPLRLYPDPKADMLVSAIAKEYGLSNDMVFAGIGSDDVLAMLFMTFFNSAKPVLFPDITYSFYDVWAEMLRIPYETQPLDENFHIVPEDYMKENGGIVIANPNAPTGVAIPVATIEKIVKGNPDSIVIVDEAYVDFSGQTCMDMVKKYPNVVVSRTMSKSFSLAGLRLGIAAAQEPLIFEMFKVKDSYNVDMITQYLATAALRDVEYMQANAKRIIATREKTAAALRKLGCVVEPSATNFLFVKPPKDAETVFKQLKDNGFLVRYFKLPRVSEYIRITMGTEEDMDAFVKTFADIIAQG